MFFVSKFHDTVCSGLGTYIKYCTTKSGVEDGLEVNLRISISKVFDSTQNIFLKTYIYLSNEKLIDFYFKRQTLFWKKP